MRSQQEREEAKGLQLASEVGEQPMEVPRLCRRCGLNLAALVVAYNAALRRERRKKGGEFFQSPDPTISAASGRVRSKPRT